MKASFRSPFAAASLAAVLCVAPLGAFAQTSSSSSAPASDRWLHVRVESRDNRGESVKVNVPLEMAEKVLPAINKDRLHNGKVRFNEAEVEGVDIKALLDAVRTSKDGEFVTVQAHDADVRVAKQTGYFLVYVTEKKWTSEKPASSDQSDKSAKPVAATKSREHSRVEVKIPMKVVDALFSAGKDELDLVAGLRALSAHGDTELVSVKDEENTVRVWLDSKNVSD